MATYLSRLLSTDLYRKIQRLYTSMTLFEGQPNGDSRTAQTEAMKWLVSTAQPNTIVDVGSGKCTLSILLHDVGYECHLTSIDSEPKSAEAAELIKAALAGDLDEWKVAFHHYVGDPIEHLSDVLERVWRSTPTVAYLACLQPDVLEQMVQQCLQYQVNWIAINYCKQVPGIQDVVDTADCDPRLERVAHPYADSDRRGLAILRYLPA